MKSICRRFFFKTVFSFLGAVTLFCPLSVVQAQTWLSSPGSGDWNTGSNWDTSTIPNSSSATATFGTSADSSVTNTTAYVTLGGVQFNSGASSYTFTNNSGLFLLEGAGVADSSGATQRLVNNGVVIFGNSSSTTATSAGDLVISGSGSTTFTGHATAGQSTIANQAILEFDTNANAGSASVSNGGLALFLNSASAGQANLVNAGTVSFGDTTTAGSATILNNNSLSFGVSATGGDAHITNNSGANLAFSDSTSAESASITNNGTLSFGVSAVAENASITNNRTLGFNNYSSASSAIISNSYILDFNDSSTAGNAQITNSGILNFTGSSTAGAATIATNNGGRTVFEQGTTGGTAQFTVNAGGVFDMSGVTSGALTVGSYTQVSGGTLKMTLDSGPPAPMAVSGTAALAGTLDLVYGGSFSLAQGNSVTILTAGNVSGLFDQWNNPQGERLFPFYSPTALVYLESVLPTFQIGGLTANQEAIAQALDGAFEDRNRHNLMAGLVNASTASLPALYSQMDPAGFTSFYQMGFRETHAWTGLVFRNLEGEAGIAGDTAREARKASSDWFAADLPAAEEKALTPSPSKTGQWKVSLDTYGDFGTLTGDGNSPGYQFTVGGLMAGAQYPLSGDWTAGVCLGYGQGSAKPDNGGEEDINGGQAGLFAAWQAQGFHAEALVGAGLNQTKTQRPGYGGTASANANEENYTGRIGLGYGFRLDELKVKPFASAEYTYVQLDAFTESGSTAPLSFSAQGEGLLLSDLGFSVEQNIQWGTAFLTPGLTGAWEHAYQVNPDGLTASLGGPGESFTVQGPATGQDCLVVGAHLDAAFKGGWDVYGEYRGRIGLTNYTEQGFEGGVKTQF